MSIVVASSRGFKLGQDLPGIPVEAIPGATLETLRETAESFIPPPSGLCRRRIHFYFLCGVPDISRLVKGPNYRECIYDEEPSATAERYCNNLSSCQQSILRHGALPVFATIPKFNIEIYNNDQLSKGNTSVLHYEDQYKSMQANLVTAIDTINSHIYNINRSINVSTPFLHSTIIERRGRKNRRYNVHRWDKFTDGLHPSEHLRSCWADVLQRAMSLNSALEDSEDEAIDEDERSWKRSSKRPRVE